MFSYSREEEEKIRAFWDKENIPEKFRRKNEDSKKVFYLMDGPPYATGNIHLGTALNKILKDVTLRYRVMRGYNVFSRVGYDTHGLPIENKVEKQLGFDSKSDIEEYGVDKFVEKCIEFATQHISDMTSAFYNLGVWMQLKDPYLTLDPDYVEGLWTTFKKADEKGLLYKGKYPVHVCPHCGTAVAYNEIEYQQLTDTSIYVKFPLVEEDNTFLVIWTTTPWTLPANLGVMVHPNFEYAKVKVGEEYWIIAKELLDNLFKKLNKEYSIVEIVKGEELENKKYLNPLHSNLNLPKLDNIYRVILSDRYVHLEEGTGLVHCAPGHGKEDFDAGTKAGLPVFCPVNIEGKFDETAGKYKGMVGRDANPVIIEDLRNLKALVYEEKIRHDYPTCWRCHSPLLMVALPQWFFKVSSIKDKLIEENEKVNWVPSWGKDRFRNWLENINDWPVSRNRYWGTPLPIWVCDKCGKHDVIGTYNELEEKTGKKVDRTILGIHRPNIDNYTYKCECGGTKRRVKDVLDVWFDSGATSWGALHYPHYKDLFEKYWPADINIEGTDQFRGWWNSQSILSYITFEKIPFKNVVVHGMVLDINKREMHKSWGNAISPSEVIEKENRDFFRYFMVKESRGEDFAFGYELFKDIHRFINIFSNMANYMHLYLDLNLDDIYEKNLPELKAEDKWIISRFNTVKSQVLAAYDSFKYFRISMYLEDFLMEDLSRTYLKIIKDREDKENISKVLSYVFGNTLRLLAPIMPHYIDFIYKNFNFGTIHLSEITDVDVSLIDENLEKEMSLVKDILQSALKLREEEKLRLRWTLPKVYLELKNAKIVNLKSVLERMLNVEEIEFSVPTEEYASVSSDNFVIYIPKKFDASVKDKWFMQELRRAIQEKRKKLKFNPNDLKNLELFVPEDVKDLVADNLKDIEAETNTKIALFTAKEIKEDFPDKPIKIFEKELHLNFI